MEKLTLQKIFFCIYEFNKLYKKRFKRILKILLGVLTLFLHYNRVKELLILMALFIEYHSHRSSGNCSGNCSGYNTITPLLGWHISSNLTRFARAITAIISVAKRFRYK